MEFSLQMVVSLLLGVTVFLVLTFMANTYINSGEQTLIGFLP